MSDQKPKIAFTDETGAQLPWVCNFHIVSIATLAIGLHVCNDALDKQQTARLIFGGVFAVLGALALGWVVWGSLPRRAGQP